MEPSTVQKLMLSFTMSSEENINAERVNWTSNFQSGSTCSTELTPSKAIVVFFPLILRKKRGRRRKKRKRRHGAQNRISKEGNISQRSIPFKMQRDSLRDGNKYFYNYLGYSQTKPMKKGFTRPVIIHRAIFGSL